MSKPIPLFPLNVVVFPGKKLNLHIFEPRYKQLIHDCRQQNINFGMPAFINNAVTAYGTEIKLLSVDKTYTAGELDIKTKGIAIFRIVEFIRQLPGKPYAGGVVELVEVSREENSDTKKALRNLLNQLYEALRINSIYLTPPEDFKAYDIAHHLGLSLEQEFNLLQITKESDRQLFLLQHLQRILPVVKETERLKERIEQNGHFKHLLPPTF